MSESRIRRYLYLNTKHVTQSQQGEFTINLSNVINSQPNDTHTTHYEVCLQSFYCKKFFESVDTHNSILTLEDTSTSPSSYTQFEIATGSYTERNDLTQAFGESLVAELKRVDIIDTAKTITLTPQVNPNVNRLVLRVEGLTDAENQSVAQRIHLYAENDLGDAGELLGLPPKQNVNDNVGGFIISAEIDPVNSTPFLLITSPYKMYLFTMSHVYIGCSNTAVNSACGAFTNRQVVKSDAHLTTCIGRAFIDSETITFDAYNVDESTLRLRGGDVLDQITLQLFDKHGDPLPHKNEPRNDNGVEIVLCIEELSIEKHPSLSSKAAKQVDGGVVMSDPRMYETRAAHERLSTSTRRLK
eukprot:5845373-Pleurochrysis_carterae.AAC.3